MNTIENTKKRQYKNYIFDLYGTLIDVETDEDSPFLWGKMAQIYSAYGADYSGEELRKKYIEKAKSEEDKLDSDYPEIDLNIVFLRLLKEAPRKHETHLSVDDPEKFASYISNTFRVLSRKKLKNFKNTEKVLKTLKESGKGIYLLSNAQAEFTETEIDISGIRKYFDDIFLSSDHGIKKPSPEFMEELIDKNHLYKDETVMVGNDISSDIKTAFTCGMDSIYLNTFKYSDEKVMKCLEKEKIKGKHSPRLIMDGDIIHLLNEKEKEYA